MKFLHKKQENQPQIARMKNKKKKSEFMN